MQTLEEKPFSDLNENLTCLTCLLVFMQTLLVCNIIQSTEDCKVMQRRTCQVSITYFSLLHVCLVGLLTRWFIGWLLGYLVVFEDKVFLQRYILLQQSNVSFDNFDKIPLTKLNSCDR